MEIYIVNRKYYIANLDAALDKAKDILRDRAKELGNTITNNEYRITRGKNKGYCVTLLDDWEVVGNKNLLRVAIQVSKLEFNT